MFYVGPFTFKIQSPNHLTLAPRLIVKRAWIHLDACQKMAISQQHNITQQHNLEASRFHLFLNWAQDAIHPYYRSHGFKISFCGQQNIQITSIYIQKDAVHVKAYSDTNILTAPR